MRKMVPSARIERATYSLGESRSIQLSYESTFAADIFSSPLANSINMHYDIRKSKWFS